MQKDNTGDVRFDDSTVMKLLRDAANRNEKRDVVKEVEAEYRKALSAVANTRNGQFVLKYLVKASGINSVEYGSDIVKMADARGRRNFFLEMIWQYLTPAAKQEIQ